MNSKQKGARGERAWRDALRDAGFLNSYRGQQFHGGADSPDVVCPELPGIHFEVKHVEALNIWNAMEQSVRDCGSKMPLVAHKRNRSPWLVTMRAEDFFRLIKETDMVKTIVDIDLREPQIIEGENILV